jgi:hypothetical protein
MAPQCDCALGQIYVLGLLTLQPGHRTPTWELNAVPSDDRDTVIRGYKDEAHRLRLSASSNELLPLQLHAWCF